MKYFLFLLASTLLITSSIYAQNQPNLGFEHNNFIYWKCYADTSHFIPSSVTHATNPVTGTNTTYQNLFIKNYLVGPKLHFLETTSGTAVDKYGGYPIVCNLKNAGLHSCKIGSDSAKGSGGSSKYSAAQGISYNVHIPNNMNKYKVVFYYAINLEDPGSHECWQMPFFLANAFDSANPNNVIACAQFRVDICTVQSDPQLSGNWSVKPQSSPNNKDVYYTPWTPATLIAKNMAGKTLTVQFMSAGCSPTSGSSGTTKDSIGAPGAHFGYAYVDFDTTNSSYSDSLKYCSHDTCLSFTPPPGYKGYIVIDSATRKVLGMDTSHPVSSVTTFNLCGSNLLKPKSVMQVILTPYAGFGCVDTLTYYVDTLPIHILPPIVSPKDSICAGIPMTLTDAATGGTWVSDNIQKATIGNTTGIFNGVNNGRDTIMYLDKNMFGCADTSFKVIYVGGLIVPAISGKNGVCLNDTIHLSDSTTGGTWASSNTSVATISPAGIVKGLQYGNVNITYSFLNTIGCNVSVTKTLQVGMPPLLPITGRNIFCGSKSDTLFNATKGGIWVSSNTSVTTINQTGILTAVTTGTSTIKYIYSFGGCSDSVTYPVTVASAVIAPITGTDSICINGTYQYNNATTGGNWDVSNSNATITSSGSLSAIQLGKDTVWYVVTTNNGCTDSVSKAIIILNKPTVSPVIAASQSLCAGKTLALSDSITGGSWTSSNTTVATVSNTGIVTGISAGTVTITYTLSGFCSIASLSITLTINDMPLVNTISGNNSLCAGTSTLLTDITTGGSWSSNNTAVASISNSGLVTAFTTGTTIISYAVTNTCGTTTKTTSVTVTDVPVVNNIAGNNSVCAKATTQLTDATANGTWNSSNTQAAVIDNNGLVTGIASGNTTINYTITNACGSTSKSINITVNDVPVVDDITGNSTVCTKSTIQLSDNTPGGLWSGSNLPIATVSNNGVVTGITSGNAVINYTVSNSCGANAKTYLIFINDVPFVNNISGNAEVCKGGILQLADVTTGGVWSSSNPTAATIDNNGIVTGEAIGNTTISYAVTNDCGTTTKTTVINTIDIPVVSPVTGINNVCSNSFILLSDSSFGGNWNSINTAIATVSTGGIVTGISLGSTIINYTVTNICGITTQPHPVTVFPIPNSALSIYPKIPEICIGDAVILTDSSAGVTVTSSIWYLGNNSIDSGNVVSYTYQYPGTYWVTHKIVDQDGCLSTASMIMVTVDSLPVVQTQPYIYVLQNHSVIFQPVVGGINQNSTTIWTPDIFLSDNTILNPVCTPQTDTTYKLTVRTSVGCTASDTTRIIVLQTDNVPNVFSPNGDGIHDTWDVPSLHKFPSVKINVFDRNGQNVFQCSGTFVAWDGRYKGSPVPTGVYYYLIDRGFNLPVLSGSVTVLR